MDTRDSHRSHIERALIDGSHDWSPHTYSLNGPFLMYYIQGMLMSVWVVGTEIVEHVPLIWPQDASAYRKHQVKFERSVRPIEK